jgi:hypothetical protein|tara:strand:- start:122 stop:346 length:225 start_codon:yes stop_codon:yes gene_type:complete
VQDTPAGACICTCNPSNSKTVPLKSLDRLPPGVRGAIHEMFDGVDDPPGTATVPTDWDQVRIAAASASESSGLR